MATKPSEKSDDSVDVNKKTIEKLLRTNSQIISKLEVLITDKKNLETHLEYVKELVKKVRKSGIYAPVQKKSMDYFFRKKIARLSIRGTFTSRVKDVMYSVFEATGHKLPSINTQASPSKIQEWKSKAEVKRCYNNLFKKVKDGQPTTYMSLIIDKLRKENKNPSKTQIAYAISICETYLNPNNQNIQMSKSIMKSKIINNLQKLENRDKFTHSDDDSHDGNDVDDGGDRAADDRAGAADNGVTNDGRPNDGAANDDAANDGAANDGAANDGIADDDILSIDSYNTEEEGRFNK
ncbi:hypothetical protein GLOIN_2v1883439 [Rhizophagus irregularis DAOM 181602=DAOM 197198]|nr:hypothetical protein GLOIN_2v1883439 [Rhizophagus irregularis DAOM 181602=DAOM 197198]